MIDTVPPDGHIADAAISLRGDGGFELDRRHRGIRQRHLHGASPDRRDRARTTVDRIRSAPIRHRAWRPRHRRLWLDRHFCRRTRHAGGGGKARRARFKAFAADAIGSRSRRWRLADDAAVTAAAQRLSCRSRRAAQPRRDRPLRGSRQLATARRARSPSTCRAFASP